MREVVQRLFEKGEEEVAPALLDFFAPFLKMRFRNYIIGPLIEETRELSFQPARSIFAPFGFKIGDLFEQKAIEHETTVETVQKLKKTLQNPPNRVALFASKYDEKAFKNTVMELRQAGVRKIVGLFLCNKISNP